jgi:RNA polymerase sigma-70 factor (ECF subfamily)
MALPEEAEIRHLLARQRYREAFELIVVAYGDKAYRLAYAILGDEALAEDSAQDAFLRAWRGLDSFRGQSSLSTWLYAITRNTCLTALKSARSRRWAPPEEATEIAGETSAGPPVDVIALVEALPDKYRQVVRLFYMEERSYQEVAELLDLPLGTVKTYLHRARRELALAVAGARIAKGEADGVSGV